MHPQHSDMLFSLVLQPFISALVAPKQLPGWYSLSHTAACGLNSDPLTHTEATLSPSITFFLIETCNYTIHPIKCVIICSIHMNGSPVKARPSVHRIDPSRQQALNKYLFGEQMTELKTYTSKLNWAFVLGEILRADLLCCRCLGSHYPRGDKMQ